MTTNTLAKLAPSSVLAFSEALHGAKGELDAWLECNNEAEVKAHIFSLTAQAPAITDHDIETLAHRICWRYDHTGNYSGGPTYTFNSMTLQEFARKLMRGETK